MGRTSRMALAGLVVGGLMTCQPASGAEIGMPLGSTVWMAFNSSVPPLDQQDVAGSNLPGFAPPNGIDFTTVTGSGRVATGYAEILPDRIRSFGTGNSQFLYASFQDTYTISGAAPGPFDIGVQLHVIGTARTIPFGPAGTHAFLGGGVQARIGTFVPDSFINESFRVSPFNGTTANPSFSVPTLVGAAPNSVSIDLTASYIKTGVNIGDMFDIAYQVIAASSGAGEIDLLDNGGGGFISFTLPEGVFLTSAMAQALPQPGNVRITGNDRVNDGITSIDLPVNMNVSGNLEIIDNDIVQVINIAAGTTTGNLDISDNAIVDVINIAQNATSGNLEITENAGLETINIAAGLTTTGNLDITGNDNLENVNIGAGMTSGNLTIVDNGDAAINIAANATASGNLTLETEGSGNLDLTGLNVGGNSDVTADGYTSVESNTAAGQTALTMINSQATMELVLPTGTFPQGNPVHFTVENLGGGAVEMMGDDMITYLASYRFNFDVPTLGDAELNFAIDLRVMDEPSRQALLDLLDMNATLTLAVRGDEPGAELNLFEVCGPGMQIIPDECVQVLWFDANGAMLDPLGVIDPTVLRFEGLVGHFSTYSVVAVTSSTAIPEPTSLALLGAGAMLLLRRQRRRAA